MLGELKNELRSYINPEKAAFYPSFFKSKPGQYAEGDRFLGVTVPHQRKVANKYKSLPLSDIEKLLESSWHEERLTALLILVLQMRSGPAEEQTERYRFYLAHMDRVNNWDLVDTSARDIVGLYIYHNPSEIDMFEHLARSDVLWERRIAMVGTYYFLIKGDPSVTLRLAEILMHDPEDLMHKAVGWMLREMGKRCDQHLLTEFLDAHAHEMPRTMLRYSIEHLSKSNRQQYLRQTAPRSPRG